MEAAALTPDDRDALIGGRPVRLVVDDIPCVVVREDVFDAVSQADDDARAAYPLILKAWDAEDENPDQYLAYLGQLKR